jgi:alkylation response protein AidB-like acyl-CoA dehydrogenase
MEAVPDGDKYRITGTKVFITWGDHSMSENIVHLVLARIEGASDGIQGLSLFAVPKYKVNEDGSLGDKNDLYPASVEHKLGVHASPTCVMSYGENGGAIGHVIGEENKGLACMFSMMNHARLNVGIQGLSLSERAYQLARDFALERVQGEALGVEGRVTIIKHADVRRMLMLMKVQVEAMRAAAFVTASQLDFGHHGIDDEIRGSANVRMALLTPIIKGWLTEVAQEVTSVGLQIHGGMGFVEETGAAQHLRDARILPIYEGTTGIQANDLVGRKILADGGQAMAALIADMREVVLQLDDESEFEAIRGSLGAGIDQLEEAVNWLISNSSNDYNVPGAASVNLLMLAGVVVGGWQMARAGLVVSPDSALAVSDPKFCAAKRISMAFYAEHILPRSYAYLRAATAGTSVIMTMPENSF